MSDSSKGIENELIGRYMEKETKTEANANIPLANYSKVVRGKTASETKKRFKKTGFDKYNKVFLDEQ